MPVLNFKREFRDKLLAGLEPDADPMSPDTKAQTMRRRRVKPIYAGDTLHLWIDQRQSTREKIGVVKCSYTEYVIMYPGYFSVGMLGESDLPGKWFPYPIQKARSLALLDGFGSVAVMLDWFRDAYGTDPILLQVIRWEADRDA